MYRRWPLAALAAALTLMTAPAAFGAGSDPPAAAGWHGREIRDPLPQRVRDAVARFPRGWSAGGVGLGQRLRRPGRLAARARGAAAVAAPRLPARPGRRALRRAHARRGALVSDQARPAAHGPRRRPQRRDPAPAPASAAHARDRGAHRARPAPRRRRVRSPARRRRRRPSATTGRGCVLLAVMLIARPRGDRRVGANGAARTPHAARSHPRRRAARAADRRHAAHAPVDVIGYVAVARGARARPRARHAPHRSSGPGARAAAGS